MSTAPSPSNSPQGATGAEAAQQLRIDDSQANCAFSNFCRVAGTPEELILDFGLSTEMGSASPAPIHTTHRLIINYYTAKRLLHALQLTVERHESAFGVLEVDVQKRVKPGWRG